MTVRSRLLAAEFPPPGKWLALKRRSNNTKSLIERFDLRSVCQHSTIALLIIGADLCGSIVAVALFAALN